MQERLLGLVSARFRFASWNRLKLVDNAKEREQKKNTYGLSERVRQACFAARACND